MLLFLRPSSSSSSLPSRARSIQRIVGAVATTVIFSRAAIIATAAASADSCSSSLSLAACQQRTKSTMTATTSTLTSSYPLLSKTRQSSDSYLLRFALPPNQNYLGVDPTLPTCISVHHNSTLLKEEESEEIMVGLLKKSYSPVSHPGVVGTFDLLVKSYKPQPGGGVGHAICNLQIGQSLIGKLKSERFVHGSPTISQRWDNIGLVAGGTGVAPLIQLARIILDNPNDKTKVYLLSINRNEEDILMKDELDEMAREYVGRFTVNYSLTGKNVREDWEGYRGRGSVDMARETLPPPSSSLSPTDDDDGNNNNNNSKRSNSMIFVCGTDGFRDMWGGPIGRAPPLPDGTKGPKIQGPLMGLLKEAGYSEEDVFKY